MKLKDEYLNIMANGWLLYQTIVCRLFARSGFYQSGGAIGYRDQLQDSLAIISSWPEKTRSQIIRAHNIGFIDDETFKELYNECIRLSHAINALIQTLKSTDYKGTRYNHSSSSQRGSASS